MYELCSTYVVLLACVAHNVPFYSSKGRLRLQGIGVLSRPRWGYDADLLETSVPAWPRAVLLQGTLVMMAHAFPNLISCMSSGIGLGMSTLVHRDCRHF